MKEKNKAPQASGRTFEKRPFYIRELGLNFPRKLVKITLVGSGFALSVFLEN